MHVLCRGYVLQAKTVWLRFYWILVSFYDEDFLLNCGKRYFVDILGISFDSSMPQQQVLWRKFRYMHKLCRGYILQANTGWLRFSKNSSLLALQYIWYSSKEFARVSGHTCLLDKDRRLIDRALLMQAIHRTLSHPLYGKSFWYDWIFSWNARSIIDGRPNIESKQGAQYQSVQNRIFVFPYDDSFWVVNRLENILSFSWSTMWWQRSHSGAQSSIMGCLYTMPLRLFRAHVIYLST